MGRRVCSGPATLFGNVPVVKNNFSLVALGIVAVSLLPMLVEWLKHRSGRHVTAQKGSGVKPLPWSCASFRARAERRVKLREANVLGARTLGALALLERHSLAFAEAVELAAVAGGLVEEVFVAIASGNKAEAFFAHQPLDRAVRRVPSEISSCE